MSAHAIAGLVAFNFLLLAVGWTLLYALRGFDSWNAFLRLGGLAYLLGVAVLAMLLVLELLIGLSLSLASILITAGLVAAAAIGVARRLGRGLPRGRLAVRGLSLPTAVFSSAVAVYMLALFRSGRLEGLYEFDGWAFWVPKAKAIYFFGGLDHQFFEQLPGPSYPPLVPAIEASAFHFMGSPDVVTAHLQFWFLLLGFIAAVVGLLAPRVHPLLLWPPLLLLLTTPHVVGHALQEQGDILLDIFIAIAAVLLALWLLEAKTWGLVSAAVFAAASMSTKREGILLSACLFAAGLAGTWRLRGTRWKPLVVAGIAAGLTTIPWRIFLAIRDLSRGGAEAGGIGLFEHVDRAWPSLRLALSALFDFDVWLVAMPLMLVAIVVAFLAGAKELGRFSATLFILFVGAFTWVTWAFPSLPITKEAALNPIVRLTGSLVFVGAAITPLLLMTGWRNEGAT